MTPAEARRSIAFYNEHYEVAAHGRLDGKKVRLNSAKPQNCRYCGRTAPVAKFSNKAHAFPEFLGNHTLISCDECDDCNRLFAQTLEDSLSKITILQRVAARVKGKHGKPAYKSKDEKTRWDILDNVGQIKAVLGDGAVEIDLEKKELRVTAEIQPHCPRYAYKCLVKMALAVMPPEDLPHFKETLNWLQLTRSSQDKMNVHCPVVITTIAGFGLPCIIYSLLRRRQSCVQFPHYTFTLGWANFQYQIFLPFSTADAHLKGELTIPNAPTLFHALPNPPKIECRALDWSSLERKVGGRNSILFKGDEIVKTDPPKPDSGSAPIGK